MKKNAFGLAAVLFLVLGLVLTPLFAHFGDQGGFWMGLFLGAAAGGLAAVGFPLFGNDFQQKAKLFGPLPWLDCFLPQDALTKKYRAPRVSVKR